MESNEFKKIMSLVILAILGVLSFLLLKPILLSIIIGAILALILSPVYDFIYKRIHSKNLSAIIICLALLLMIILPLWFLTPLIIDQSFKVFQNSLNVDFVTPLQSIFPSLFASEQTANELGSIIQSFITKAINSFTNSLGDLILNFPTLFLQLLVVIFTFFFLLRDKDLFVSYLRSILPFGKETEDKIFDSSRDITYSVIYGQIVIGMLQGIIVGIGFFVLGIPNALFLAVLACFAGIFPIIGTTIVWVPVVIYLLIEGNTFSAMVLTIFGLTSNIVDNFLRPIIVSKRARMHSAIILVSMVGGLFLFGVLGFILGPLIIAYFFIILDLYRNKKTNGIFISHDSSSEKLTFNFLR